VTKPTIETYKIESEADADYYVTSLLADPQYRSIAVVNMRAQQLISDPQLRKYFIAKGQEILNSMG
jgi:hypothetical protein